MRKALFVIVLVGSSFAGGAAINGPGLRWAQSIVANRLGFVEDKGPEVVVAGGELAGPTPIVEEIPASPIPPLVLEPISPKKKPLPALDKAQNVALQTATPLPTFTPVPEPVATPTLEPLTTSKDRDRDALVLAASTSTTEDASPGVVPDVPNDWTEVRRELKSLGVSRYGTEGDPSGRVRFHCVIPLAGRRAVGQHFEAEGDDDLQAARAALKRVVLWRATEAEAEVKK